jgi:hypothetical protein
MRDNKRVILTRFWPVFNLIEFEYLHRLIDWFWSETPSEPSLPAQQHKRNLAAAVLLYYRLEFRKVRAEPKIEYSELTKVAQVYAPNGVTNTAQHQARQGFGRTTRKQGFQGAHGTKSRD